jgi:two-component system, LuxR family, sensor kinase FixL
MPILLGLSRQVFLAAGLSPGTERVLSLAVGAVAVTAAAFYFFLLGARQNIAELREAKQALAARNAELEVVVASAADGIFTIDSGGVIQSANQAATALFGFEHSELVGQNVRMLMGEPYRSEHDSYLARYVQTREAHVIGHGREVEARHKDGTIFPIFLTVNEFRQNGRQYFAGNVHDRSNQVRQMAALVRSNRDLEQFAAVASHDLQTPARSIISFVEILREDLPRELLTDETAEFMDHLHSSAVKMREQITGLLQISRLKQTRDRYARVDLTDAVEAARGSLAEQVSDTGAHVEVGDLGQAWGDQVQLRLLFENLLSNAIKYRDFNRTPQINIFATDLENPNSVHIVFQDNGIGINADQRERVFEIFQRLHTASQTEYQGTGIGLALCRRIVDQHHGRIEVDSAPDGPGSMFHLWLPKTAKSLVMQPSEEGSL